jgi:hypothetical protein
MNDIFHDQATKVDAESPYSDLQMITVDTRHTLSSNRTQ